MRSPFLAAVPAAFALAAGLARWAMQGSGNLYTATARRAYVPDPDLGWRVVDGGPPWLGLEILGVLFGITCAVLAGAWVVRRLERRRGAARGGLRAALWTAGVLPLAIPAWAFAGGFGPEGARDTLPASAIAAGPATATIEGALDAPAGTWQVIAHPASAITARVSAGGEAFDARFAGDVTGAWQADPRDLRAPMSAEISAAAATVDTGVGMRSKSARDDYLRASEFPRLGFRLDRLVASEPRGAGELAFRAEGAVSLIGGGHPVVVTGTLRLLDDAARARLGITESPAILAEADFAIRIPDTALAADAGDFDGDEIPVHATLVLVHRKGS